MKVIFVNRFFHPDESATSLMLTDLVCGLRELKADRIVITGQSGYTEKAGTQPAGLEGVRIIRLPGLPVGNSSLLGRAINFIAFYLGLVAAGLWHAGRGDIFICLTDPPLSNVIVRWIASFKRAKVINWVQDIYPETAARLGFGTEDSALMRVLIALRDQAWRSAHANVCIGEHMRDMLTQHGAPAARLHVIANWADEQALTPLAPEANPLRTTWGFASDNFIVGYSGNLGRAHDASTMLEAADRLSGQGHDKFKFLFIGGGAKHALLKDKASLEPAHTQYLVTRGYRPRSELGQSLCVPDVHWLSLEPELEGLIVPSKFYGAVAAGRPIIFIGDTRGEIARLIDQGQCGHAFSKGDVSGLVSFLLKLQGEPDYRRQLGVNARRFCEAQLTRDSRLSDWSDLLERTVNGPGAR